MTVPGLVLDAVKFVLGAFVGAAITKRVEGKADLVSYFGHSSAFTTRPPGQPPFIIHTHDVVIQNVGKKAASNVRVSSRVVRPRVTVALSYARCVSRYVAPASAPLHERAPRVPPHGRARSRPR